MPSSTGTASDSAAIRHAVAQQDLEGLTVPHDVIEDMRQVERGEISEDEIIRRFYSRHPHVKVFQPR